MGIYSDVIFPAFFDQLARHKFFDERRGQALKRARGRILEIGAGTGLNLDYYPESVNELTALEPNPGMRKQFLRKAENHRIKSDFFLNGAERMPFENESFDTVVSTLTLCSIPKLPEALLEVKRVLTADGLFIFLDHGISDDARVAKLQRWLNPVQKVVGAGCQLTVDIEAAIKAAGFKIVELNKFNLEKAPKFVGSMYEGVARK